MQKLVRAAFGNNNIDTCARVCHSPTGFGLKQTLGDVSRHPGLRLDPAHRRGASSSAPTRPMAIPVFASQHEAAAARRARSSSSPIRAGSTSSVRPMWRPTTTCKLRPGTNVARHHCARARRRHRRPGRREAFVRERCDWDELRGLGRHSWRGRRTRPRQPPSMTGVPADEMREARPPVRHRRQWRDLLRPRRHRAQPGLDHGHGASPISRWPPETSAGGAQA